MQKIFVALAVACSLSSPTNAHSSGTALRVVTLNVWGLPTLTVPVPALMASSVMGISSQTSPKMDLEIRPDGVQNKNVRIGLICNELKRQFADRQNGWDIVFLQEVWEAEDQKHNLAHCGYFTAAPDLQDGKGRSGLMILSRYPLSDIDRNPFRENGAMLHVMDGEYLVDKSVMIAKVSHSPAGDFWVANTHLVSDYPEKGYTYRTQRRQQFLEAVDWIREKTKGEPTIFGGDFNFGPELFPGCRMHDELYEQIGNDVLPGFRTCEMDKSGKGFCTISALDEYNNERGHPCNEGKIDHIFVSPQFKVLSGGIVLNQPVSWNGTPNGRKIFLSDHFGFELTVSY